MSDYGGAPETPMSLRVGRVAAPLREQVVDVVRQAILDFRLKPGQRLIERELIELTGVSRTTIREVLRQLAAEGLITTIPQKGAIVVVPSADEARELTEIRAALEVLAVRRFVENADDDDLAQLGRALRDVERAAGRRAVDAQTMLSMEDTFFDVILEGARNGALKTALETFRGRLRLLRATALSQPARPAESAEELASLYDAVTKRNANAAGKAVAKHVESTAESGLAALAELQPAAGVS